MSIRPGQRAALVSRLRAMPRPRAAPAPTADERCELCARPVPDEHRHLLQIDERRIVCVCEACWALRSGDAEYRPTGHRIRWLPDLVLSDDLWARFAVPIGLAMFFHSAPAERVVALYPSPAGPMESELDMSAWRLLEAANPVLADMEADIEGLLVNRLVTPSQHAIAPIDRCYALGGVVKMAWQGISGGSEVAPAVTAFFADLERRAR